VRKAKHIVDPFLFAPTHQLVATEPAIAEQGDPHPLPTLSNLPMMRDLAQLPRSQPPLLK
jgi:hypothetical protein